ncbi:MAG: cytidine deaminase [Bacteroidaceae bacterium]|nr:cytidine deaminase [Bacteroidaceae bacterium]MBR3613089.1 cytidine deaminase [Bacteroidaceae bacterium]
MKEMVLQTKVVVCAYEELMPEDKEVVDAARAATANSYAVYSKFNVGAAVRLEGGVIVKGSNQENAAYPSGLCAERTTLFWANSQYPDRAVLTLAIAARTENGELAMPIPPCGACRQVILETEKRYNRTIRIILYGTRECYVVEDGIKALLPLTFDASFLDE